MIATNINRVSANTPDALNEAIREQTRVNVARAAALGPRAIEVRLKELDREWDIERCIETVAPSLSLFGLLLGATVNRKWFLLPAVVQAFLLQHGVQGWCPPVPALRALGVRTQQEIDEERFALKALRGDFRTIGHDGTRLAASDGDAALRAAQA